MTKIILYFLQLYIYPASGTAGFGIYPDPKTANIDDDTLLEPLGRENVDELINEETTEEVNETTTILATKDLE